MNVTDDIFSKGYTKVILIGSDMPLMTSELLNQTTFDREVHDCVLGSAVQSAKFSMESIGAQARSLAKPGTF
ncbi:hypothetical protein AYW79_04505 [Ferroacidibacillus organovorans]|uniref:MobA-like NTP transferase domain-containing protein n=1 Tax=Ferroacidibacillus organovorans TaxID=1765683 RepID=A0A853KEG0_9BACL|nr:DUF2064 domain-containing protein [Ferroacidibacillus organovorans]KYP79903.1 hypothetical protein AYJ22_03110 [Ferroacidibacillus organovorans]OAG94619.1 hypothetical protein AYW79_04505 [Ferroacidibacillus organovorans]